MEHLDVQASVSMKLLDVVDLKQMLNFAQEITDIVEHILEQIIVVEQELQIVDNVQMEILVQQIYVIMEFVLILG